MNPKRMFGDKEMMLKKVRRRREKGFKRVRLKFVFE